MDYTICIRKEAAMCGAVFTSEGDFKVNVAGTTGGGCTEDYLSFGTEKKCGIANAVQAGVRLGKFILNKATSIIEITNIKWLMR